MHSLYFLCLYKAASFYRRVNWKPKRETRQTQDLNTRHNACNKLYTLSRVRVGAGSDLQLWDVLDFKRSETLENPILNFATKLSYDFFLTQANAMKILCMKLYCILTNKEMYEGWNFNSGIYLFRA